MLKVLFFSDGVFWTISSDGFLWARHEKRQRPLKGIPVFLRLLFRWWNVKLFFFECLPPQAAGRWMTILTCIFVAKTVAQNHQLVFFQFLHLPKALGSSLWVDHGSLLTWRTTKVACRGGTGMFYHNFPWNSSLNHHLLGIFFLGVFFQSFEETNPTTEDDITVHGSEILRQPAGM